MEEIASMRGFHAFCVGIFTGIFIMVIIVGTYRFASVRAEHRVTQGIQRKFDSLNSDLDNLGGAVNEIQRELDHQQRHRYSKAMNRKVRSYQNLMKDGKER